MPPSPAAWFVVILPQSSKRRLAARGGLALVPRLPDLPLANAPAATVSGADRLPTDDRRRRSSSSGRRSYQLDTGEIGPVTGSVASKEGQLLDLGMGADEEVGERCRALA